MNATATPVLTTPPVTISRIGTHVLVMPAGQVTTAMSVMFFYSLLIYCMSFKISTGAWEEMYTDQKGKRYTFAFDQNS